MQHPRPAWRDPSEAVSFASAALLLVALMLAVAAGSRRRSAPERFSSKPLGGSLRASACAALSADSPAAVREACSSPGGAQDPALSLHGVPACVGRCSPRDTCGRVLESCAGADRSPSAYRCEVTHLETRTRSGAPLPFGPDEAPWRVFVAAAGGCLAKPDKPDGANFRDDPGALRLMMTFPEKLRVGEREGAVDVPFPSSWSVTMTGAPGWPGRPRPGFALPARVPFDPSPGDGLLPAVSVFLCSRAEGGDGLRPTTFAALANRLHVASAREPPRPDGTPPDPLYASQPLRLSFTVSCGPGESGLGAVVLRTLPAGGAQEGGIVTTEAARRVRAEILDGERDPPNAAGRPTARWDLASRPAGGAAARSPLTGAEIPPGAAAWICLTVDAWSGRVVDCREVLHLPGRTVVSRARDSGVRLDLSAELPVTAEGAAGVSLGVGSAPEHFFGARRGGGGQNI